MRILVCGGRQYGNANVEGKPAERAQRERMHIYRELYKLTENKDPDEKRQCDPDAFIISGAARGADTVAIEWAVVNWVRFKEYPADWKKHPRAAGPIRNQLMLDDGKPDVVLAFPGGTGTADMVRRAEKAGIQIIRAIDND